MVDTPEMRVQISSAPPGLWYIPGMKIGINGRFLNKPFTGIGQYTKNLFKELAKIDSENEYIFVVTESLPKSLVNSFTKNVKILVLPEGRIGSAGMKKTWWEQIQLPELFLKEKCELVVYPYPSNPWTKDWYKKDIKTVVTVHDCIPWTNKNYQRGILSRMYHAQSKKAVGLADFVLTVSEASKKEIEKICAVKSSKIKVIYNDADEAYKTSSKSGILKKFNLKSGKYFIYAGGYDERKNVKYLMSEFAEFQKTNEDIFLVLAGGKIVNQKLYGSFDGDNKNIIKTGFLESEDLGFLYKNSIAFVHMSKEEGFNIPLIEAVNCGTALILSDIKVHREIADGSAIFVNTKSDEALVKSLEKVMREKVKKEFVKKSSLLAKKYSWKKSAKKLKDMLSS